MKTTIFITVLLYFLGPLAVAAQEEGETAPDFTVGLLDGGTFTLSDHTGKVVFIFFFGNSCPSCIGIGPTIESNIHRAYSSQQDFVAVGLDTWDNSSGESSVSNFQSQTGITFPLAIKAGSVAINYSTTYDRLMVIGPDGVIRHKGTVAASNDVTAAKSTIDTYLATSAPAGQDSGTTFRVYPQPARDRIHVFPGSGFTGTDRVRLYSISGRLVWEKIVTDPGRGSIIVPAENLSGGVYVLEITGGAKTARKKVLIQ